MTNSADASASLATAPRWLAAWVVLFAALWPMPGYAEAALALGALVVTAAWAWRRLRGRDRLLERGTAWLAAGLFCAYWLPELLSAFAALDPARAWREAAADLRYLPFLCGVAIAAADTHGRRIAFGGLAVVAGVWTVDALAQALTGTSPLFWSLETLLRTLGGRELCGADEIAAPGRLGGAFGACNPKLGLVLASLSPFALFAAARRFGLGGWLLAAAAIGVVVALAGARAAWVTFGLALLFSGWRLLGWKRMLPVALAGLAVAAALYAASSPLQQRVAGTLSAAESGDVDGALAGRVRIWEGALCMARAHPLTGVGVRGFRTAWPQCDPAPAQAAAWGEGGAFHAHQIVLEVLSETGAVGLLLWLAGAVLAWRAWRCATPGARERARPAMLALALTVFPLNTHLAFYSTFWGGLTLLLAGLYAGAVTSGRAQAPTAYGAAPRR